MMELNKESVLALSREEPVWLKEKRLHAWDSFSASTPLPFFRYGLSIITPLEGMNIEELDIDGNSIEVSPHHGIQIERSAVDQRLFSSLSLDRFSSMHIAFCNNFLHIKIPDNTELSDPLFIQKTMTSPTFFNHLFIDVGKNCKLSILESLEGGSPRAGGGDYHSGGVEIFLGEGSSLLFGSNQNLSTTTYNFSVKKAFLQRDSRLEWVTVDTGSLLTLSRIDGKMEGQGSSLYTKMMVFGTRDQHFDFDASSIHRASDTYSDLNQKAVLDGKAKLIMNGLVKIEQNAPRSNGYQKEDTLLLSPDAEASPIPNLEIDNTNGSQFMMSMLQCGSNTELSKTRYSGTRKRTMKLLS